VTCDKRLEMLCRMVCNSSAHVAGALNLQGIEFARKGVEIARKGIFKESPQNSHVCEFAGNGFIQEIKKWNPQGTAFARNGISKERN